MVIIKIVIGTVAVTGLAGAGIAGLGGSSSPKSQADPLARTHSPAVVASAHIYAPIAALPAWVEQWRAGPAQRLGTGVAPHHSSRAQPHAGATHSLVVASAPAPRSPARHRAARPAPSHSTSPSTPVSYHPSSHTVTRVSTTRSGNGSTTTTRTTTTRKTSKNGTTSSSSHTESTTTTPGTHPTVKPAPKPSTTTTAPVATTTTAAPTPSPSSTSTSAKSGLPGGSGGGYHTGSGYYGGAGHHSGFGH